MPLKTTKYAMLNMHLLTKYSNDKHISMFLIFIKKKKINLLFILLFE